MAKQETRDLLVGAARNLFYHQGYLRTTLAEVADGAGIPVGNVYYHFKTKESLLDAVLRGYEQRVATACAELEQLSDPRARLRAFFGADLATAEQLAQYGCPYGTICQELEKIESPLAASAQRLLGMQVDWVARQLAELGKGAAAREIATSLIAVQQGLILLTNSFGAPDLLLQQLERLDTWLAAI